MMVQLPRAAAWQEGDNRAARVQIVGFAKFLAALAGFHSAHQRMADKFRRYACTGEKFLLEWKNAQCLGKTPPHQIYAPWPPRPELRANVINVANTLALQLARQPQVKTGKIRENG